MATIRLRSSPWGSLLKGLPVPQLSRFKRGCIGNRKQKRPSVLEIAITSVTCPRLKSGFPSSEGCENKGWSPDCALVPTLTHKNKGMTAMTTPGLAGSPPKLVTTLHWPTRGASYSAKTGAYTSVAVVTWPPGCACVGETMLVKQTALLRVGTAHCSSLVGLGLPLFLTLLSVLSSSPQLTRNGKAQNSSNPP